MARRIKLKKPILGRRNFLDAIGNECKPMMSDLKFSVDLMRWIDDTIL